MEQLRRGIVIGLVAALGASIALEAADGRPRRRPKRSVEYYTFPEGYLDAKVAPYVGLYSRVVVLNELATQVTAGRPICRLGWEGRRVEALLGHEGPLEIPVRLPRGATVDAVSVYLVDRNGTDGEELHDVALAMTSDTLLVTVADTGDALLVDLQYRLGGEGISVDETFYFQPEFPVLKAEYRFAVARDLWQAAADHGLSWEFAATSEPRTWAPIRSDTAEFFSWYWRDYNVEPPDPLQVPRSVSVTGFLPLPLLARFDPEELPNIEDIDDVLDFTADLINDFQSGNDDAGFDGGTGGLRDRYAGSRGEVPDRPSIGKSVP